MATPNDEIQTDIELQKLQFDKLFKLFAAEDPYRSVAAEREKIIAEYINKLNLLKINATKLGLIKQYENQFYHLQYKYLCYSYLNLDGVNPDNLYKGKARFTNNNGLRDKIIDNYNANYNPLNMHIMGEGPETEKDVVRFFENVLFNSRLADNYPKDILVAGELTPDPTTSFFPYFQKELNITDNGHVVVTHLNDLNCLSQNGSIKHYELNISFDGKKKSIFIHQMIKFPDHGLPQLQECDILALLEIFQQTKNTGLVMHCRAGLGRTGMLELAYIAFNNPDQYFNGDGSVNYGSFYNCLDLLRKTVRPRIIQSIAQGMNAIEISQQLIRLYLTLKKAHIQTQQQSYQGDINAINQLLQYYQTVEPAFDVAEIRETDFIEWSSKIIQSDKVAEREKSIVKKEIEMRNNIQSILARSQFIAQLDQLAKQDISLAMRILCNNQLRRYLGMDRCLDILIYHRNSDELFRHLYIRNLYQNLMTAYAMKNAVNAKLCLTNDNIRGLIDRGIVLEKYISDPQFFALLTLSHMKRISDQFDFIAKFTDCSEVCSIEILKKAEEFYHSDQLTGIERERLKKFLLVQHGIKQLIKEKGQKNVFVTSIIFEENSIILNTMIQINNYTTRNEQIKLSMIALAEKATAHQQSCNAKEDHKEDTQIIVNRSDRAHRHHLNLMQRNASRSSDTAPDQIQPNNKPGMGK